MSDTAFTPALNHVELVHRPGERELAKQVFQLLGCSTLDRGGEFVSAMVDGGDVAAPNNVLYVSEVTPEQWRWSRRCRRPWPRTASSTSRPTPTSPASSTSPSARSTSASAVRTAPRGTPARRHPQRGDDPPRARRPGGGVRRLLPGRSGAYTDRMAQAFVWTDVMASGLLTIGQHVELQWHLN